MPEQLGLKLNFFVAIQIGQNYIITLNLVLAHKKKAFLEGPVEEVCAMVNDWQTTHELADLSPEVWQFLKDNKFFAMIIKKNNMAV